MNGKDWLSSVIDRSGGYRSATVPFIDTAAKKFCTFFFQPQKSLRIPANFFSFASFLVLSTPGLFGNDFSICL